MSDRSKVMDEYWLEFLRSAECSYRQGRWTGEELKGDDVESRYGERGVLHDKEQVTEEDSSTYGHPSEALGDD